VSLFSRNFAPNKIMDDDEDFPFDLVEGVRNQLNQIQIQNSI